MYFTMDIVFLVFLVNMLTTKHPFCVRNVLKIRSPLKRHELQHVMHVQVEGFQETDRRHVRLVLLVDILIVGIVKLASQESTHQYQI